MADKENIEAASVQPRLCDCEICRNIEAASVVQGATPLQIVLDEITSSTGPTGGWLDSPKALAAAIARRLKHDDKSCADPSCKLCTDPSAANQAGVQGATPATCPTCGSNDPKVRFIGRMGACDWPCPDLWHSVAAVQRESPPTRPEPPLPWDFPKQLLAAWEAGRDAMRDDALAITDESIEDCNCYDKIKLAKVEYPGALSPPPTRPEPRLEFELKLRGHRFTRAEFTIPMSLPAEIIMQIVELFYPGASSPNKDGL